MRTWAYERTFVMPVRPLPPKPSLDHLRYQAKDLLKAHAARDRGVAQRVREFHPRFKVAADEAIFAAKLNLADAQLAIAREYGFKSWARLKAVVDSPETMRRLSLPHHERIDDQAFRRGVELIDAGDVAGLGAHLKRHPTLVHQHVEFEGGNYFRNPTLLEFIAENPIRRGSLRKDIVEVAKVILDAGANRNSMNETLGLVATGRVPRECGVQIALIDLLCDRGADPNSALEAAAVHGEFDAVHALIRHGAAMTLPVAAAMDRLQDARRLLLLADDSDRRKALAIASQYGHEEVVRLLLESGVDANGYGGVHTHSTPLHQAALAGKERVARLLVEYGADVNARDLHWHGTPADWARHEKRAEMEKLLRELERGSHES
jgi:hypothetical protein